MRACGAHSTTAGCLPPWHKLSLSLWFACGASRDELCERGFRAAGSVRVSFSLAASSPPHTRQLLLSSASKCVFRTPFRRRCSIATRSQRKRWAAVLLMLLGNSLCRRARLLALWAARGWDVLQQSHEINEPRYCTFIYWCFINTHASETMEWL